MQLRGVVHDATEQRVAVARCILYKLVHGTARDHSIEDVRVVARHMARVRCQAHSDRLPRTIVYFIVEDLVAPQLSIDCLDQLPRVVCDVNRLHGLSMHV